MAKTYQVTGTVRFFNGLTKLMVRLGLASKHTYILTVRGRKSGRPYSTPVSLVEVEGQRWLVAPYGEVNWVKNARVAGEVTLSQGRHSERVVVSELGPTERAPILKLYLQQESFPQSYFDSAPDDPLAAFEAEAECHPVFLLLPKL